MTETGIKHFLYFTAPPAEIYQLLMDQNAHAAFSGSPAKIDPRVGGKFSVFNGEITGVTTELEPSSLVVQDWRGADWPAGTTSRVRFSFKPHRDGRGCALRLTQTGVPADKAEQIDSGWRSYYWEPMAEYVRSSKVDVVRRFLEGFKNQADLDVVDETWTEDCVLHVPGFKPPPGREAQKQVGRVIFNAFTEVHVDVIDTIVEGDRVVERHRATAKHTGEFMGIPATQRDVHWTENHIYRMENNMIAEAWSEVSFHDLIRQISEK